MSYARRLVAAVCLVCTTGLPAQSAFAMPPGPTVDPLLETSETVLGEEFVYPDGPARITAAVITVPPGAVLAPHLHPVPLFAYILQGALIVDYGSKGEIVYRTGDALVEAMDWPHQGRNGGRGILKILVVYAGSEELPNTEPAALE